jgi:FAD/FMN-containing dehydrogenase
MDEPTAIKVLTERLGLKGWLPGDGDVEPFISERRKLWRGHCLGVAQPSDTAQVAEIIKLCSDSGISVTPQGGNTGLVGGGVPYGGIVLSTGRMNHIREIDTTNQTMTVDAGCILANIQAVADENGLFFPLSLGAEGTCQIGGNLSTNAGGVGVLRYGNARDLVLGLEVVLADGQVLDDLNGLRKDNTGYDLKHLFMGAEGTLGIITGATLKLFPKIRSRETTLIALPSVDAALAVLTGLRQTGGDCLSAFEIMNKQSIDLAEAHFPGTTAMLDGDHPQYALVELTSPRHNDDLRTLLEDTLLPFLENGTTLDAWVAENEGQASAFWRVREAIPEAQTLEGASIKHDVSVAVSAVPTLIKRASDTVLERLPGVRVVAFGHMGDGNIHFNLSQPVDMDGQQFLGLWDEIVRMVHDIVMDMGGSFSAEHGIGTLKRDDLTRYGSPAAIDVMSRVKSALDPHGLMNPGKVLTREPENG